MTEKSVEREPTTSRKRKATQSQEISTTSIQKGKIQEEDSELEGQSDSIPEAIMEVPLEPASQVEKTPNLNIQNKKKFAQSKASGFVLHPKDQLSQCKKRKKEETDQ